MGKPGTTYKDIFNGIYEFTTDGAVYNVVEDNTDVQITSSFNATSKSICHLRVLQSKKDTIVIATELHTNPGPSVTNTAEIIAQSAVKIFHVDPTKTRFIEHYGQESYEYEEGRKRADVYDSVTFTWEGTTAMEPVWKPIDVKELEKILQNTSQKSNDAYIS
jgi:hypothetical protein